MQTSLRLMSLGPCSEYLRINLLFGWEVIDPLVPDVAPAVPGRGLHPRELEEALLMQQLEAGTSLVRLVQS